MKNIKVIKHKAIGLIGGMGPQASSYTYKMLIDLSVEHYGAKDSVDFPQIIIDSLPIPDFVSNVKNLGKAKKLIKASIRGFNKLDVSCLSLACNSAHMFIKELQNQTTIPFISMIDAVVNEVKKDKFRTVGIIGTPVIMRSTLYQNAFKKIGVKSIIPENTYFAILDKIIRKVVVGTNSASDSRTLAKIADLLIQNGAECIVLGCTEIPLAFPKTYKHKAYNSVEILCKALLRAYYDL